MQGPPPGKGRAGRLDRAVGVGNTADGHAGEHGAAVAGGHDVAPTAVQGGHPFTADEHRLVGDAAAVVCGVVSVVATDSSIVAPVTGPIPPALLGPVSCAAVRALKAPPLSDGLGVVEESEYFVRTFCQ